MRHLFDFEKKDGISFIRFRGEINDDDCLEITKQISELPLERKLRIIIDLSETNTCLHKKESREMLARSLARVPGSRIAVVASTPVTRMMAKTLVATLGEPESTVFFKNEEEAIKWLR